MSAAEQGDGVMGRTRGFVRFSAVAVLLFTMMTPTPAGGADLPAGSILTGPARFPAAPIDEFTYLDRSPGDITVMSEGVFIPQDTFTFISGPPAQIFNNKARGLVRADQASTRFPTITGAGYTVAILDTGVDAAHPALSGRVVAGFNATGIPGQYDDDHGHGTHVAGIAGSNDATYTGIAPGANVAAVKVLDSAGNGTWANIESGLQWVIDNRETYNIVSLNMSLGTAEAYNSDTTSPITDELAALKNAGVFIAASSGNFWYTHMPDEGVAYPAADVSAVAVGSVWSDNFGGIGWSSGAKDLTTAADLVVSHTDRSSTMLDILAPGALITSASHNWETGGDFVVRGGTSMASPAVAGMAVLIRQAIEENWPAENWPTGAGWQDTILQIMRDYGETVHDGDDEDDNVDNLNIDFIRIDALDALTNTAPEPATLAMLSFGGLMLFRRRRRT